MRLRLAAAALPAALLAALLAVRSAAAAPVTVSTWHVIGPFEAGSREGMVHPLAEPDGRLATPWDFARTWPSPLVEGGRAGWSTVESSPDGEVALALKGQFEALEGSWGPAASSNVAVLVGTVTLAQDGLLLVDASRCGGTFAGQPFAGDPYGAGIARSVVRGRRGDNEVVLLSGGYGGERKLSFTVQPVGELGAPVLVVGADVTLPDIVRGVAGEGVAGVPLLNLTDRPLDVTITLAGAMTGSARSPWALAPLSPMKLPVPVRWSGEPGDVIVSVETVDGPASAVATPAVRAPGEARLETFVSRIDGSAQVYGFLPATDGPAPGHGLVLSTHGAGVGAQGQAASYAPKAGWDVVAPTNRRPYGFDWHDWGRLDFEEVMDLALQRLGSDRSRVVLTGHSMGGHGAWTLGALHPGRFACVAPSAGWMSYDTYVPFTLRRSTWLAPPELDALLLRGLGSGRAGPLLENLRDVPVLALHGGADDNVPPAHGRMLSGLLERLGGDVRYVEVPGQGHWWDLDTERPGADAVDSKELEDFWRAHARDPLRPHVTFTTLDTDIESGRAWISILAQQRAATAARVDARVVAPDRVELTTGNVARLGIVLDRRLLAADVVTLAIEGHELRVRQASCGTTWLTLARTTTGWRARIVPGFDRPGPNDHAGGLAKALFTPFAIVLPTRGDAARCESLAALGRLVATAWWVRGNGLAPIVRDTDVTDALRHERNLLLLGGPDLNAETARLERSLVVRPSREGVTVFGRAVRGSDLACAHWQPSRDAARRVLVMQATSAAADALLPSLQPIAAGAALPDVIVATPRVRVQGWAGLALAGYFTPDFRYDASSTWSAAD